MILKQASDTLELLGMEFIVYEDNLTIQFNFDTIQRDPVALVVFCTITGNDPPKSDTFSKSTFSKLTRPELAILAVLLANVEAEKRSTVPQTKLKEDLKDILPDTIVTKSMKNLSQKGYISYNENTVSVDWRINVEMGLGVSKIASLFEKD